MESSLDPIGDLVRPELDSRFAAREQALADSRKVIRSSANAIRHLHRDQVDEARRLIATAGELLAHSQEALADHPDVLHAGFVWDAAKEFAEANLTLAVVADEALPMPAELGVDPVPYLHGLGETVGECRRRLLDRLRDGDLQEAERLLELMGGVVDLLADLDYPDGMTSGLRRTTDVARGLTERSRSDLTATAIQERLRADLADRLDRAAPLPSPPHPGV